jgi:hypothetical protein
MAHSTFAQPLPEALAPLAATGYRRSDLPPRPFAESILAPAGALSATGTDMGRFMLALLDGGSLDGARILRPETLAQMMAPQVTARTGYMGLAFAGVDIGGTPFIGHDGGTLSFLSTLLLSPENRFGVFVSYDGFQGIDRSQGRGDIARDIIQRYFPPVPPPDSAFTASAADAEAAAGVYQTSRRADSTMLRLSALASQILIRARGDGTLTLHSPLWPFGAGYPLNPAGPGLYRSQLGGLMAFDDAGGTIRLTLGAPAQEFRKVPWHLDARLVVPAALASVLIAVLTLIAWPVAALWRWFRGRSIRGAAAIRRGYLLARLVALEQLGVAAAFMVLFGAATADPTILSSALDPVIVALYGMAWLGVAGGAISLRVAWQFWRERESDLRARLHHTLLAASAMILAWLFVMLRIAGTTLIY